MPAKEECFQHGCTKKGTHTCQYCHQVFCSEHIGPKPVGFPRFHYQSEEDEDFMALWRDPDKHPCAPYSRHWFEERARKRKEELEDRRPLELPEKGVCKVHLCYGNSVGSCDYCGREFCLKHLRPKKPFLVGKDHSVEGHNCPIFALAEEKRGKFKPKARCSQPNCHLEGPYTCSHCRRNFCHEHVSVISSVNPKNGHRCLATHLNEKRKDKDFIAAPRVFVALLLLLISGLAYFNITSKVPAIYNAIGAGCGLALLLLLLSRGKFAN